eukprot:jgi/Chlat1/8570/Chrsp82S07962
MDLKGQQMAESLQHYIIMLFTVLSFAAGYVLQSFKQMMAVYATGVIAALLVTVPDWPFFNRHPLKFLPPQDATTTTLSVDETHQRQGEGAAVAGGEGGGEGGVRGRKGAGKSRRR